MNKQTRIKSFITLFFTFLVSAVYIATPLFPRNIVHAETKVECDESYAACVRLTRLAIALGSNNQENSQMLNNCQKLYQSCLAGYSGTQPQSPAQQAPQLPITTNSKPQTIPQMMTEREWLSSLGLDQDQLEELSQGQNTIVPFYQSPQQKEIVGLTATSLNLHDQLTKDYDNLSSAKQNNVSSTEINKIKATMAKDQTGYKQSLESLLMANPKDPIANYEMGNVYFNEGTADSFVAARNLHFRAFMNLDQQERTNLQNQVQQNIERNGFEKAFSQPSPQNSSFLGAMNDELDSKLSGIKNIAKDWLKQSEIYSRAETYSNTVRQTISDVTDNIFKVDNKSINQATYGQ